jgi:hypothetical protein
MNSGGHIRTGGPALRIAQRFAAGVMGVILRGYAVCLIGVLVWLTLNAFSYLLDSLLVSTPAPPEVVALPRRLDPLTLQARRPDWLGLQAVENPRVPLAHFHRYDAWVHPDRLNNCTQSGCHAPLPHSKRKEVRAYLNMHATSIHCGVCHVASDAQALPVGWYDLETGEPRGRPALLEALAWLSAHRADVEGGAITENDQAFIVELLRRTYAETDRPPAIRRLADDLAAVRAGSDAFSKIVDNALDTLPNYFRGSYGTKAALIEPSTGRPDLGVIPDRTAVEEFLRDSPSMTDERRQELIDRIHPPLRSNSLHCTSCHTAEEPLVDLPGLGYPPSRIESLRDPLIFQMIEHISEGAPFRFPGILAPEPPNQGD